MGSRDCDEADPSGGPAACVLVLEGRLIRNVSLGHDVTFEMLLTTICDARSTSRC